MRRFYQVAVLTVALLSLLAFLVYKHEYERLKNILQVLNTFGDTSSSRRRSSSGDNACINCNWDPSLQAGGWRQLNDGIHVVSTAFTVGQSIFVHGIIRRARAGASTDHLIPWTQCNVWLIDNIDAKSVPIRVEKRQKALVDVNMWSSFTLICDLHPLSTISSAVPSKRPIAVSFSAESLTPIIDVHQAPTRSNQLKGTEVAMLTATSSRVAICGSAIVDDAGLTVSLDESMVVQFIEYHRFVGVNRFVIYVDGLLHSVRRRLQTTSSKYSDLLVEIINWNAPTSGSDRSMDAASAVVMKHDCMARLGSDYGYVLFLELNELMVSRYHSRLSNFVNDEANVLDDTLGGLRFDRRIFCTELEDGPNGISETELFVIRYKNDLMALPPMFTKTRWIAEADHTTLFGAGRNGTYLLHMPSLQEFSRDGSPILKSGRPFPKVNEDFASIHAFVRCGAHAKKLVAHANLDDIVVNKIRDQFL